MKSVSPRSFFFFAATVLLLTPLASAHAAFSSTADTNTPAFNAEVDAIVRHGDTVYVGGSFTGLMVPTLALVSLFLQ